MRDSGLLCIVPPFAAHYTLLSTSHYRGFINNGWPVQCASETSREPRGRLQRARQDRANGSGTIWCVIAHALCHGANLEPLRFRLASFSSVESLISKSGVTSVPFGRC